MSWNLHSKVSEWPQNCSKTTLLNLETNFDTQIVFRDRTEPFFSAEKIWWRICHRFLGVFGPLTNTWATTLGGQRSFWVSQEALSSTKINLHIPRDHISVITSHCSWYKTTQRAKKFEKVKNIGFFRVFRFSAMGKNRHSFAFWSWKKAPTMVNDT